MSSGFIEYLVGLADDRVDFASDIAFKATDDLGFAHSLRGSATHICLCSLLVTQSDHDDTMKCGIGLAVASTVESMPVRFAG